MNTKSLAACTPDGKLIEDYSFKNLVELAASTPGPVDRALVMQCYNELLTMACQDAYFGVTESMGELLESIRLQRSCN